MTIAVRVAMDEVTRERIYRFRHDVLAGTLGWTLPEFDAGRRRVYDAWDDDATLLYAEDGGRIVGTVRWLNDERHLPSSAVDKVDGQSALRALGSGRIAISDRAVIDPAYRSRTLVSLLMQRHYAAILERGVDVDYRIVDADQTDIYSALGYDDHGRIVERGASGRRGAIMRLFVRDREWLRARNSPFSSLLPPALDDRGRVRRRLEPSPTFATETGRAQSRGTSGNAMDRATLWARLADSLCRPAKAEPTLFDDLRDHEIDALIALGRAVELNPGEALTGGRRRHLAVVLDGTFGIGLPNGHGHHWVRLLAAGHVFDRPPREAQVSECVALDRARAALLPRDFAVRLDRRHPDLAMRVARNHMAVLRHRIEGARALPRSFAN